MSDLDDKLAKLRDIWCYSSLETNQTTVRVTFDKGTPADIGFDTLEQVSLLFGTKSIRITHDHEEGVRYSSWTYDEGHSQVVVTITLP